MDIKEIKKRYNLTDYKIAEIFDYKNPNSYANSSAKPRFEKAIERLFNVFEENERRESVKIEK